jgi:ribose 5-phosphate isomerase A
LSEVDIKADDLARAAVAPVDTGMIVGVGTGRAATRGLHALVEKVRREKLDVQIVSTSERSEALARELGLQIADFARLERIDYLFDGADEVDRRLRVMKGSRGAFTRERMIAAAAERCVFMVGERKLVEKLGESVPLAIAVMAFGLASVRRQLRNIGLNGVVRRTMDGQLYVTDNGNLVLDVTIEDHDIDELATSLNDMPGVIDHGLFIGEADEILVETENGLIHLTDRGKDEDTAEA